MQTIESTLIWQFFVFLTFGVDFLTISAVTEKSKRVRKRYFQNSKTPHGTLLGKFGLYFQLVQKIADVYCSVGPKNARQTVHYTNATLSRKSNEN